MYGYGYVPMKSVTRLRQFNNLIVYANQEELDQCLSLLFRFKKVIQKILPYKLHRLSMDVISVDFFCCSLISNCVKMEFMIDRQTIVSILNGDINILERVINKEYSQHG